MMEKGEIMATNSQNNEQNLKENGLNKKVFAIFSLLAILAIGGILVLGAIVMYSALPLTGYAVKVVVEDTTVPTANYTGPAGTYSGGPTAKQGESLPYQGVSQAYLDGRFAKMKATQAMYEASGVLEDSANSIYYGVNSSSGHWCSDSDHGNFYVKGITSGEGWSVDDVPSS